MFTVYSLYSLSFNQIYISYTSDLLNRILSHNQLATKGCTLKYRPSIIAYTEEFDTKAKAMKREKKLKSANGREYVRNLIAAKFGSSSR